MQIACHTLKEFWDDFYRQSKWNIILPVLTLLLAYGFFGVSVACNNDHAGQNYDSILLYGRHGRWGGLLLALTGLTEFHLPFWSVAVGLLILLLSSSLWIAVLHAAAGGKIKASSLLIFSLFYLSSPINYELFIYPNALILGSVGFLFSAISNYILLTGEMRWKSWLSSVCLGAWAIAIYEAFFFVHLWGMLTIAFLYYFYEVDKEPSVRLRKPHASYFASSLLSSVVLYLSIRAIVRLGLGSAPGPDRRIFWLTPDRDYLRIVQDVVIGTFYNYAYNAFFYFAILVFVVALFLFCLTCYRHARHRLYVVCLALMVFATIFTLTILTGRSSPYRMMPVLAVFVSLSWMLYLDKCQRFRLVKMLVAGWVILLQTREITTWSFYDYQVYEIHKANIQKIGYDLQEKWGYLPGKTIVAVNGYEATGYHPFLPVMPLKLFSRLPRRPYVQQNAGKIRFGQRAYLFSPLFKSLTGLDIRYVEPHRDAEYQQRILAQQHPGWPHQGYIREYDDCILVNLGDAPTNHNDTTRPSQWIRRLKNSPGSP